MLKTAAVEVEIQVDLSKARELLNAVKTLELVERYLLADEEVRAALSLGRSERSPLLRQVQETRSQLRTSLKALVKEGTSSEAH